MATARARSESARIAALTRWSAEDAKAGTAKARAAWAARWEREVDPDGLLEPEERARRADCAMRAYMAQLRLAQIRKNAGGAA